MAFKGSQNVEGSYEEDEDNDGDHGMNKNNTNRRFTPDSPHKKLLIDMSACDASIKQEGIDSNMSGKANLMFGSEGGGFLDILASVATSKLEEEQSNDVNQELYMRSKETEIEQGFLATDVTFRAPAQPLYLKRKPDSNNLKRLCEVESGCTFLSKRANPRRLADYDRFGFSQISRMSLNTLLRLFSDPDFDEMRRIYSYTCYFMPDGVCQEKVQSFGNEARAKAQMKNHLQGHIKVILKRDDYNQFTAEPILARKKRTTQQQKGTNDNTSKATLFTESSVVELSNKNSEYTSIKNEFSNMTFTNSKTFESFAQSLVDVTLPKNELQYGMDISRAIKMENMCHKMNSGIPATQTMQDNRIMKLEPLFVTEHGKENVSTPFDNENIAFNTSSTAIIYPNQGDKETCKPEQNLASDVSIYDYPDTASKFIHNEVPEGNSISQDGLVITQNNEPNEFAPHKGQSIENSAAPSLGPIVVVGSSLEKKSTAVKIESTSSGNKDSIIHDADFPHKKMQEAPTPLKPTEVSELKEGGEEKHQATKTLNDIHASVLEDHCYSVIHKLDTNFILSKFKRSYDDGMDVEYHEHDEMEKRHKENIQYADTSNTQSNQNDSFSHRPISMEQTILNDEQSNDPIGYGIRGKHSSNKYGNEKSQDLCDILDSNEIPQNYFHSIPSIGSEAKFTNQTTLQTGIQIISENQFLSYDGNCSENASQRKLDSPKTSSSVPISPITITSGPIRTRRKTRPASESGFSVKVEAKQISQQAEKEKCEALQAIRQLQAKGATTEDLSCYLCQPSKCFTAYTTLLSHLRSHAGIRPYECHVCRAVFTRQHSLNYHLLIHQNETRFTCNDCGRKFRHPSHYKEHCRRHTGESPYQCTDCSARYKTRNTFKRHLKVHHGKLLTASGTYTALPINEIAHVQEIEERKQQNKSNNKIQSISGDAHSNNNNINVAVGIKPIVELARQSDNNNLENTARQNVGPLLIQENDDFVIDYHYGDSISNDEEVARISAVTVQERTIKAANVNEIENNREQIFQVTDKNALDDGRHLQAAHRSISAWSSESYYPSSNSEFSTPSVEESNSGKKRSPMGYKITQTPPLLKFDALPPSTIASASSSVTFQPNNLLNQSDIKMFGVSSIRNDLQQRKRNYSEASTTLRQGTGYNSVCKQSAFDPISNFRLPPINNKQTESNGTNGVVVTVPRSSTDNIFSTAINFNRKTDLEGPIMQQVMPENATMQGNTLNANKHNFILSSSTCNRKTFIVQTVKSGNSATATSTPEQCSPHIILKDTSNNISNPNKNGVFVSERPMLQTTDQAQKTTFSQYQGTSSKNIKTLFPIFGNTPNTSPNFSTSSLNRNPKQALLAQVNGRQVLLIPKQEESIQGVRKTFDPAIFTSKIETNATRNMFSFPQYKIVSTNTPQIVNRPENVVTLTPEESKRNEECKEPSKLEQCLRYGSAAVVKPIIPSPNVLLPYSENQHRTIITNNDPSHSTPSASTATVPIGNSFFKRQFFHTKAREPIDSMRRDSSDSGKSDIITYSAVDDRPIFNEQIISYPRPSPISSQASKSYQFFSIQNSESGGLNSSLTSHQNGEIKDIINSGNTRRGDSKILQETLISSGYKPFLQAKDICMTNEDQVLQAVNEDVAIKRYNVSSQLEYPDFRSNQFPTQQTEIDKLYNDSDRQNLSVSSDSGFKDQSLNIRP